MNNNNNNDGDNNGYEKSFNVLHRSYHDGSFIGHAIGSISYGSYEQLAEREKTLKEKNEELLNRCRERKIPDVIRCYPTRAVTTPLRRPQFYDLSRILTPASEIDNDVTSDIQDSFEKIMNLGEGLKSLESEITSPKRSNFLLNKNLKKSQEIQLSGKDEIEVNNLSLYGNLRSRCGCCRWISMLHRIHKKNCSM